MLFFCGRSEGSTAKNRLIEGEPGIPGNLGKTNSHFDLIGRGWEPHHNAEAAVDWCSVVGVVVIVYEELVVIVFVHTGIFDVVVLVVVHCFMIP